MLTLHDSLSRGRKALVPLRPEGIGIYSCGPTVYRRVHIGNLRTYLLTDLLVRTLHFTGHATRVVQNITDMGHMHEDALALGEDKVVAAARASGMTAREIAAFFTESYFCDCGRMNILPADVFPRASEHVPEMIALAAALEEKGATYREGGFLYFDVTKAPAYGALSGAVLGESEASRRTDPSIHRRKRRPEDFTLWLPAEPGREFRWESPWGAGWPGWHIECAAMAIRYLGSSFDIHVGGADLRFPHHENSRAMAMTATGDGFAAHWIHAAHLLVDGRKMSKSLSNEFTLDDLAARGFSPADFRYHCLTLHYRTPMNFTWEGQASSAKALARLRAGIARGDAVRDGRAPGEAGIYRRRFREALEEDLNAPKAVGIVHEAVRAGLGRESLADLAREWDAVLGVDLLPLPAEARRPAGEEGSPGTGEEIPPGIVMLASRRDACRRARDYAGADALRLRIREGGYDVTDAPDGTGRIGKLSAAGETPGIAPGRRQAKIRKEGG